jgi:uncharacterized protein (TIGR00255 family)
MKSMTGHGRGADARDGRRVVVEIHSVNRKQSEILVTLPKELASLENRIRESVHNAVSRGRVMVGVELETAGETATAVQVDLETATKYRDAALALAKELKLSGDLTLDSVLRLPGVVRIVEEKIDAEELWPLIENALRSALEDLVAMRCAEGRHLAKDVLHRLKEVKKSLQKIGGLHPKAHERYAESLRERIAKAGVTLPQQDERLLKEIAFFADRSDISEELTRLESHLNQFAHHLRKNEPVGRTLDFMTQEIFRELNTLGAKANDAAISQCVVACKSEMEKIREQVQNIE